MPEDLKPACPECDAIESLDLDRRDFIRVVGETTAGLAAVAAVASTSAPLFALPREEKSPTDKKAAKPAEALIKELYSTLSADQKKQVTHSWDDRRRRSINPNRALSVQIGKVYTKAQQELIDKILHAIAADEEGYRQISRNGTWDNSGSLANCGADIFGVPTEGKFAFLFTGHHLTVRCDGDSEEGAAFGGPMYYGHTPNPWTNRNCFYYQTKQVQEVFKALSEKQLQSAIVTGSPGEGEPSVRFRKPRDKKPGIAFTDLTRDQKALVEKVMRVILSPYRKEDADEVMAIIKTNGGMEKIHLAFYRMANKKYEADRWDFWRLEGPGFVWNYRVEPHVHTYVNISSKLQS